MECIQINYSNENSLPEISAFAAAAVVRWNMGRLVLLVEAWFLEAKMAYGGPTEAGSGERQKVSQGPNTSSYRVEVVWEQAPFWIINSIKNEV